MDPNFWHDVWKGARDGHRPGFDQLEAHPFLVKHFSGLAPTTVLVPLCGKSVDMLWLLSQGHSVIGVEIDEYAVQQFFKVYSVPHKVRTEGVFRVYESNKIEIWCGDFFKTPENVWGRASLIYDRAAAVALPLDLRIKYFDFIQWMLQAKAGPQYHYLMTFEFPAIDQNGQVLGPPFSVSDEEVRERFSQFALTVLDSRPDQKFGHSSGRKILQNNSESLRFGA